MHVFEDEHSRSHTAPCKQCVAKPAYRTWLTQEVLEVSPQFWSNV